MIVDNIDYTPATLKDFVNFPVALNAFADLPPGRHFRDNVVKGSHVADYRIATLQIPREIASAIARSSSGTSATELISTI